MPDLAYIPSGASVFIDTNIFLLNFQGRSASCTAFVERVARGEITAYVNTEVLSDLLHKLMLHEAVQMGLIRVMRARDMKTYLAANRNAIETLPNHQVQFEQTVAGGIAVLRVSAGLLTKTKKERIDHGLLTNDSVHLGCMVYRNIPLSDIATYDGDFEHIAGITVWKPSDVMPPVTANR